MEHFGAGLDCDNRVFRADGSTTQTEGPKHVVTVVDAVVVAVAGALAGHQSAHGYHVAAVAHKNVVAGGVAVAAGESRLVEVDGFQTVDQRSPIVVGVEEPEVVFEFVGQE